MKPPATIRGHKASALSILLILVASSFSVAIISFPEALQTATAGSPISETPYGTGLSGGPVTLDTTAIAAMNSGTVAGIETYIAQYYQPAGIKLVFLDPIWGSQEANTTNTLAAGGYNSLIANWLQASGYFGIKTIFFFKQFGYFFSSQSWDQDFATAYPTAQTFNANGTVVPLDTGGAVKESAATTSGSSPVVLAYGSNLQSGRYSMVIAGCTGTGGTVSGITDTQGLTYSKKASSNHNHDVEEWLSTAGSAAADTVTVTFTGSCTTYTVYLYEISAILLSGGSCNGGTCVTTSTGNAASGTTASVSSYSLPYYAGGATVPGTGSFIMSFANSGGVGSCSIYPVQWYNSNPNHESSASTTVCGSYSINWGYGTTTTAPITVPSGSWDEVSVAFATGGCSGCTTSAGWSISNPLAYRQIVQDVKQLWAWYGSYSDWIGIGEGATGDRNNYGSVGGNAGGTTPIKTSRPFDNLTVYDYANSVFFQRLINTGNGHYTSDNSVSKLWSQFVNDRPDVFSITGSALITDNNFTVQANDALIERFYVPFGQNLNGFDLKAAITKVGSPPGTLYETVYRDNASNLVGRPFDLASEATVGVVENKSVSGTINGGWVSTAFTANLEGGEYYWVAFTTHGGTGGNYYTVATTSTNVFQDVYIQYGTSKVASATTKGLGSVLWLTTTGGTTITLYPSYQQSNNFQTPSSTKVQVSSTMKMNEISFFTSDREFDPNNITISIKYPNGTTLSTGTFSEAAFHGDEGLSNSEVQMTCSIHCGIGSSVSMVPGIAYTVAFSALTSDNYAGSLGGGVTQDFLTDTVNPALSGYLGQTTWPIFQLGLQTLEPQGVSNQVYVSQTDLFSSPGYVSGSEIAMRFKASSNENLQTVSFEFLKSDTTSGTINVTLRADNTTCLTGVSGTCSHPSPLSKKAVYATGTLALSSINSSATACNSNSGYCYWANFTMSAKHTPGLALTSGTTYWLVIATSAGNPILQRDINPYKELVYYSATDYLTTWGPPADGPSDLSFKITTSVETISQSASQQLALENEYVAQSFESASPFQLKGLWVELSTAGYYNFVVTVRTDSGSDSPTNTILSTGTMTMNKTSGNSGAGSGNYVSLPAVNITGGTKYWFVVEPVCFLSEFGQSCSSPDRVAAIQYHSAALTYHYETSSTGTGSWSSNTLGTLNFILVKSDATIKTYNTKTLATEIAAYDDQSTQDVPPDGWNGFLNEQQAMVMTHVNSVFSGLMGQTTYWFTGLPTNIAESFSGFQAATTLYADSGGGGNFYPCWPSAIQTISGTNCASSGGTLTFWPGDAQDHLTDILAAPSQSNWLPWSSFGYTADNRGGLRPVDTRTDDLVGWPLTARGTLSFNDFTPQEPQFGLYNQTQTKYIDQFGTILQRMAYNGGYFGSTKGALNVLYFGASQDGFFPEFLSPAVNITDISGGYADQNLTRFGNLNQFDVIVGGPNSPTASYTSRLQAFVNAGGGYVQLSYGSGSTTHDAILGLQTNATTATTTSTLTIVKTNKITSPYSSISFSPYYLDFKIANYSGNTTPAYILLRDSNHNPVITSHVYGSGYGISIEMPDARLSYVGNAPSFDGVQYGSPRDSWVSLLINAMFYSAHESSELPIIWETSYSGAQSWGNGLQFSVDGSSGNPLLWVSNNSSSKSGFDLHLNATFYGVSTSGWQAINLQNMSVIATGTGSDIHIHTTIQANNWEPIEITSDAANLATQYTNVPISSQSVSGTAGTYAATTGFNSSNWLVIRTSSSVASVSSSLTGALSAKGSLALLNQTIIGNVCTSISGSPLGTCSTWVSDSQEGFFYDAADALLYVHFRGNAGTVTITAGQTGIPTYTLPAVGSTTAGASDTFTLHLADSTALTHYIFSWDDATGTLVNDSTANISGTSSTMSVTKTNPAIGLEVLWRVYFENSANLWNSTKTMCFVTGHSGSPTISGNAVIVDDCYDTLVYDGTNLYNIGNNAGLFHVNAGGSVGYHEDSYNPGLTNLLIAGYSNALVSYTGSFATVTTPNTSTTGINSISWKNGTYALISTDTGILQYKSGIVTSIYTSSGPLQRILWNPSLTFAVAIGNNCAFDKITGVVVNPVTVTGCSGITLQGESWMGSSMILSGTSGKVWTWDGASTFTLLSGVGSSYTFQYAQCSNDASYCLLSSTNNVRGNLVMWTGSTFKNVTGSVTNTANHIIFAQDDSYAYVTTTSGYLLKVPYASTTDTGISLTDNRLRGITFDAAGGTTTTSSSSTTTTTTTTTTQGGGGGGGGGGPVVCCANSSSFTTTSSSLGGFPIEGVVIGIFAVALIIAVPAFRRKR